MRVLLTGASGYVGSQILPKLLDAGHEVRCMSRRPAEFAGGRAEAAVADAVSGEGLEAALNGVEVALYLIHSMGSEGDFSELDRQSASNFAAAAAKAGVRRIVYLGGLGPDHGEGSKHLGSRHETAELLADGAPEFVYSRAAVVIGPGSASFLMLKNLVERLPAMVCPRWIDVRTQPIAIADLTSALLACVEQAGLSGEVQLGGADVVTYRVMMTALAAALGRRAPLIIKVPVLTPRLSSHWVGLVTEVDPGVAKPLIEGLKAETIVTRPPPPGINDSPMPLREAMRAALAR